MITFNKFKELIEKLNSNNNSEIEVYFEDDIGIYMIINYSNYLTIGKIGCARNQLHRFNNIDELYNAKIGNMCLKKDWGKITDILIDLTFSVIDDKDEIKRIYNVDL